MSPRAQRSPASSLRRHVAFVLGATALALLAMCLLPYPEYLRYFEVLDEGRPKPPWIYQRIHFDETPIDIAFFGTSRTDGAIDSRIVEATIEAEIGEDVEVVNFALHRTGRNMHYLLAKELLENRNVRFVFFEMGPLEDRLGHPQFINLADPWEVVLAPFAFNVRYLEDLIRLPGREAYLFFRQLQIEAGLRPPPFGPNGYYGTHFDRVDVVPGLTLEDTIDRDVTLDRASLEEDLEEYMAGVTPSLLPERYEKWEWRMDRLYVRKTRELCEESGATFAVHYLPFYGRYQLPEHIIENYQGEVPLIEAPVFVEDHTCWFDVDHLNARCGRLYSKYMGQRIAELLLAAGELRDGAHRPPDHAPDR